MKTRQSFTKEEAISFIDNTAPRLGCGDFTYSPTYPEGCEDVCLVGRAVEDGHSYGYSIIYLVWKDATGNMQKRELADTRSTKDNLYYKDLRIDGAKLRFELQVSGTYSGNPSKREVVVDLDLLN